MSDVPVRPQAVEAMAKAMWESSERCYEWNPEMEDCHVAVEQCRVGVQAFLAAEEIEPEYDRDWEPVRFRRLCGPWRRDDV